MSRWTDPAKKQKAFMLNRQVMATIDSYAREIEKQFDDVIEEDFKVFEELLIKRCKMIEEMRMKAYEANRKAQEEQQLADQYPLPVPGHEVSPLGPTLEQPISV